jgi:hypothetical protein
MAAAGARGIEPGGWSGGSQRTPDGSALDRVFQVLFTAHPAVRRTVDLRRLDLRPFDNGAVVVTLRGRTFLRDPRRHPWHAEAALSSRLLTWGDRVRLARLGLALLPGGTCWRPTSWTLAARMTTRSKPARGRTWRACPARGSGALAKLAVVRTPRSQFAQPPRAATTLANRTAWRGLYLAGEMTEDSSLNGALRSAEAAARAVVADATVAGGVA